MTTGSLANQDDRSEAAIPTLERGDTKDEEDSKRKDQILRRMRIQIWAGTLAGFFLALVIGAAFIAVVSTVTSVVEVFADRLFSSTPK
jgi:high-affinity iron transporter